MTTDESRHVAPTIEIELLALDLTSCGRCTKTSENLDQALRIVGEAFRAAEASVRVTRTEVRTAEDAERLRFVSSPTIRVNDHDVALELRESACGDCSTLCGCGSAVMCRDWVWRGRAHREAPRAMIVDALLRAFAAAAGPVPANRDSFQLPENLRRFFDAKSAASQGCCASSAAAPEQAESCCPPPAGAGACCERS